MLWPTTAGGRAGGRQLREARPSRAARAPGVWCGFGEDGLQQPLLAGSCPEGGGWGPGTALLPSSLCKGPWRLGLPSAASGPIRSRPWHRPWVAGEEPRQSQKRFIRKRHPEPCGTEAASVKPAEPGAALRSGSWTNVEKQRLAGLGSALPPGAPAHPTGGCARPGHGAGTEAPRWQLLVAARRGLPRPAQGVGTEPEGQVGLASRPDEGPGWRWDTSGCGRLAGRRPGWGRRPPAWPGAGPAPSRRARCSSTCGRPGWSSSRLRGTR